MSLLSGRAFHLFELHRMERIASVNDGIITCSSALTRRRVRSISSAIARTPFPLRRGGRASASRRGIFRARRRGFQARPRGRSLARTAVRQFVLGHANAHYVSVFDVDAKVSARRHERLLQHLREGLRAGEQESAVAFAEFLFDAEAQLVGRPRADEEFLYERVLLVLQQLMTALRRLRADA